MILEDAYTALGRRLGSDSTNATVQARFIDAMQEALKEMFRRCKFVAMKETATFDTVADTYLYYLDPRVLAFLDFRETENDSQLEVWNEKKFNRNYPDPDITDTDVPHIIVPMKKVWVLAQPTAASVIALVSSAAGDTTQNAVIRGISGGLEVVEQVALNGTTSVNSAYTYTSLIAITKEDTTGTVTASSNGAAVINITLLPLENERSYWQVRLHRVPDDAYTINYSFYRKPWTFSYDEALLPFDDVFEDSFLKFTEAILLKWQGDQKWGETFQIAEKVLIETMENDYFAEDHDRRMGLIELDQDYDDWGE